MSPILTGVIASGISGNLSAPNSFESIATQTVGGGVSSITFSSIPSTYKHLQIRAIAKTNRTSADQSTFRYRFNGDSGSNYSYHRFYGEGSSTAADGGGNNTYGYFYYGATTNDTANTFGASVWDILDYSNTSKNTTIRFLAGSDNNNTNGGVGIGGSVWVNTSAVNSIVISIDGGFNFLQYSSFALYGIKG
jgi:hypothetical protein